MGKKNKKQVVHTEREEKQAKRVMTIIGVVALIMALGLLVCFSFWGN